MKAFRTGLSGLVVCCLVIILMVGVCNWLGAKEWSDEIRMTYAEENQLTGMLLDAVVDSHDNVHILYSYENYQDEEYHRNQPVYQKFNRYGEALIDPLVIGRIVDIPDSVTRAKGYSMFCHANDNIYLLWGDSFDNTEEPHITILDRDGNVVENHIILSGVRPLWYGIESPPRIVVDSNDNIILLGKQWRNDYTDVFYARFNPEGELIDSLHILSPRTQIIKTYELEIGQSDTLHAVWKINGANRDYTVHYTKISPEDEFIIDNFTLPNLNDHNELHFSSFTLNNTDDAVFSLNDKYGNNNDLNTVMFNSEMEMEFQTYIGKSRLRWGDIVTDSNSEIHIIDDFDRNELDNGRYFIGYCELDEDGEIIDSLQLIHDNSMNDGGIRDADWSSVIKVLAFRNSELCVLWDDRRHRVVDHNGTNGELYMRYSTPENGVVNNMVNNPSSAFSLLPNYPNPFNNLTKIRYNLASSADMTLRVYDLAGRLIETLHEGHMKGGEHTAIWNADNIASGIYICRLEAGGISDYMKMVMIR